MTPACRAIAAIAALSVATGALAHSRSESYSNWRLTELGTTATITVSSGEVATLVSAGDVAPLEKLFADHLLQTVAVSGEAGECRPGTPLVLAAARGFVRVEIPFDCAGSKPASIRYRALMDPLPAHVHYARLYDGSEFAGEQVITDRSDTWTIDDARPDTGFTAYLEVGVDHILSGVDHIAFLLGMLLVAGTLGRSVVAVTGFTLGHSASLAAAVLGFVEADGRLVESFIGFTVALVAVEYFIRQGSNRALVAAVALAAWVTGSLAVAAGTLRADALFMYLGFGLFAGCYLALSARAATGREPPPSAALFTVTACFGLIHGFGFAGFLMETGIAGESLAMPLLGFNVGVELGQLMLVAAAFAAAALLRGTALTRLAPAAAASLCGIGVYWFVGRSLGI